MADVAGEMVFFFKQILQTSRHPILTAVYVYY